MNNFNGEVTLSSISSKAKIKEINIKYLLYYSQFPIPLIYLVIAWRRWETLHHAMPHTLFIFFLNLQKKTVHAYLCMASACCGLKRVPVRGCRRKWPGTATWRFFMVMQSPLTSRPTPPRPRNSPTPNSGADWLGRPTHRAMTPPAVINSMPRQSSMPWGSGISGAPLTSRNSLLPTTAAPPPHFSSSQSGGERKRWHRYTASKTRTGQVCVRDEGADR